ncbi:hypothetical protein DSM112329_04444 [Paraconexibacter sp. AEG42_29]|uniref:DUF6351 domain-containing protein n=1 Tax=Paraconexibacter sp. AEG42_29 TaxID=2997339 RepID=A0AAU7B0W5_9ACTN
MSAVLVGVATAGTAAAEAAKKAPAAPVISVLSNRADLLSGGDALVRVDLPSRARGKTVRVAVGKRSVTRALRRSGLRLEGLITGLKVGKSTLRVRLPDGSGARLTLTNHPQGGPVFAGPQPQPRACQKTAVDAQCNQPATFTFVYRSTDPTKKGLQPYDPGRPAKDVARTKSDTGGSVPFVVRVETGYQDRDQYRIATLFDPAKPWTAADPQPQFNRKLLITHGASCDVDYATGNAPSVLSYNPADLLGLPVAVPEGILADSVQYALGRGFVVMSTALNNSGHNCDVTTQAESLMMAKEHVIEAYGQLRYTIGTGCSGGSLAVQWISNAYPGIYQGILPTCSFPDTWSSATQVMDYHLLRAYFENPGRWSPGVAWLPTQFATVEGNLLPVNAIVSDIGFFNAIVPTHECGGISDRQRYHPDTNPGGVRCSVSDLAINVFGPRDQSVWTKNERALGRGFAGIAVDNVGVQYGLKALAAGEITPGQFADLNARIGGLDIDITPTAARITADRPALARAYRSGMINSANNLDQTAIIDCRGPDPGAAHDSYRAYAVRARLDREHGSHANQLIWEGAAPLVGDTQCAQLSLIAMDRWLAAVEKDTSSGSVAQKLVRSKPADLGDKCFSGVGPKLRDGRCGELVVPIYGTPRTAAGDAITTDANKCRLRPLDRSAYGVSFTDAQWAQLQAAFPGGVCDFRQPGVDQQGTVPWLRYGDAKGRVIYGGVPMSRAPRSVALPRSAKATRKK